MDTDDSTLTRKTVIAVVTMGGGCALFLAVLSAGSLLVARVGAPPSRGTPVEIAPQALDTPSSQSPSSNSKPRDGSTKPGSKSEI